MPVSVLDSFISPSAQLGVGVSIGRGAEIFGAAIVGDHSIIDAGVTVGYPSAEAIKCAAQRMGSDVPLVDLFDNCVTRPTIIGRDCVIRRRSVIYEGVSVGDNLDCAHEVIVREGCCLGDNVELGPLSYLKRDAIVGFGSRIASEICDRTIVGRYCSVYGRTSHKFLGGVSGAIEPAPVLEDGVTIGREACVVGNVVVGKLALVGAGAVVTKSVPAETVVVGVPARHLRSRSEGEAPELWARVHSVC